MRKSILNLKDEISNDSYLKEIPSFRRTLNEGFHAKNDTPEDKGKMGNRAYKLSITLIGPYIELLSIRTIVI